MPRTAKQRTPAPTARAEELPTSIRLFVRRGAERRFTDLKRKTATLNVEVIWDRREGDRRQAGSRVPDDRRRTDRRQPPSFTWDLADFAVVLPREPEDTKEDPKKALKKGPRARAKT